MIKQFMSIKHEPPKSYGDCMRACVASILEVDDVPHWLDDGPEPDIARQRLDSYLSEFHGLKCYAIGWHGSLQLPDLLAMQEENNPGVHYILQGMVQGGGGHAVVCCGGRVVHDPAYWPGSHIVGPLNGVWSIFLFVPEIMAS